MKGIIIKIVRKLVKLLYVIPMDKRLITFVSFHGASYTCSPKYISLYINQYYPEYKQVWAFNDQEKFRAYLPNKIEIVKYKSLKYLLAAVRSGIRINNAEEWSIVDRRKGQLVINTWHGCMYKKVGRAATLINEQLGGIDYYNISNLFLSPNKICSQLICGESFRYMGEIHEYGLPRNDILINLSKRKEDELRKSLDQWSENEKNINLNYVDRKNKILLYAPTFRESQKTEIEILDIERLISNLKIKFGGEWIVWSRAHLATVAGTGFDGFFGRNCIDMSLYADMQELLAVADILITDYSSSIWDFSFTKRPIFLYTPDLAQYRDSERGFYFPIDTWGFSYAESNNELEKKIMEFDSIEYGKAVDRHHVFMQNCETGHAAEEVVKFIANWKFNEKSL